MKLTRILALATKEWRELSRDRIYLALAFLLPSLMLFVFGYGINTDVENVPLAILDEDRTAASREYAGRFSDCRYFSFRGDLRSMAEANRALIRGDVRFVLLIPSGFGQKIAEGRPVDVQTIADGSTLVALSSIRGYVEAINGAANAEILRAYLARHAALPPDVAMEKLQPVRVEARYVYNEQLKSIWALAPSLIMVIMMWALPVLMAVAVVREKETGSIYNVYASTISRAEFLLGKLLPVFLIAVADGLVLTAMTVFYFGAPFRGNVLVYLFGMACYALCVTSLGLLASMFVRTQAAAMMIVVILGAIVATRYGGIFQPVDKLDPVSQGIAHLFPAMYFQNVVMSSFLKGAPLAQFAPDLVVLALYPVGILWLCGRLFSKVSP
jgi:ABC-2 type transport system permease protein/ribosome-dependent ATPase